MIHTEAGAVAGQAPTAELDLVTLGEVMALFLAEPGTPLARARAFTRSIAGAEATVAVGLARLGYAAGFIGCVGDDVFGAEVRRSLRAEGLEVSRLTTVTAPTGLIIRDCHPLRPIEVAYYRDGSAGSRLGPGDIDPGYLKRARHLHLSGVTMQLGQSAAAAVLRAAELAKSEGLTVSLDPNLRGRLGNPAPVARLLDPLWAQTHIVMAGQSEAAVISGQEKAADAARWFSDRGAALTVIRNGEHGCLATDGTHWWEQKSLPAAVIDPVGAGDAFCAGALSVLLDGGSAVTALADRETVQQALLHGVAVAALAIQVPTDLDGLPDRDELRHQLAVGSEPRR